MGEMSFKWGDLYPSMEQFDTTDTTIPDANDQVAMAENADAAHATETRGSRPKYIWIAVVLVVLLTIFFGVGD